MKKVLFFVLATALLCIVQSSVYGEEISPEDKEIIKDAALKQINIEPEIITSISARKVFSCKFYNIEFSISGVTYDFLLAKNEDGKFLTVEDLNTHMQLPVLSSLVSKNFRIKNEEDAEVFMEAILTIKPLRKSSFDKTRPKTIRRNDEWIFVLGKFFENSSGFIVKTTKDGAIVDMRYSLKISEKE